MVPLAPVGSRPWRAFHTRVVLATMVIRVKQHRNFVGDPR